MSYTPIAEYISSKGVSRFKTTCPTLSEAVDAINSRSNVIYSLIVLPDGSKVNLANQNGTWMLPEGFEELSVNSDRSSHSDGPMQNGAAEAEPADATAEQSDATTEQSDTTAEPVSKNTTVKPHRTGPGASKPAPPTDIEPVGWIRGNRPGGRSNRYTLEEKNAAIQLAAEIGTELAAATTGISATYLRRLCLDAGVKLKKYTAYDTELKEKALEMLKTMKLADVSSALDISINTLSKWRQETDHPLTIYNRSYSEEQNQAALESVPSLGLLGAGMASGISPSWINKLMHRTGMPIQQPYDLETKQHALAMVERIGLKATVDATGISRSALQKWKKGIKPEKDRGLDRYSEETKKRALELVPEYGLAKAREETGISLYFLKELCKESGIPPCKTPKFDEETKRRALDMIAEYGLAETRDRMGIQWQTLKIWMKKAGIQQGGKKRYYDAETKQQALEMVDKIGVMATSKTMGISTTTLREWRKDEL